jgi:hypothetical protein
MVQGRMVRGKVVQAQLAQAQLAQSCKDREICDEAEIILPTLTT